MTGIGLSSEDVYQTFQIESGLFNFLPRCIVRNVVFLIVELSVCLSVRPSVTRVNCDKTNESSADILIPYERKIYLVFGHKEWLVGTPPFYVKFWVKLTHPASKCFKNGDFQSIFARSGSAVTPSEKKFDCD